MSRRLNRKQIQRMLLSEFKMIGMTPMGSMGHMKSLAPSSCGDDDYDDGHDYEPASHMSHGSHKGSVSKEDTCAAVMCLVECCSCPDTRRMLEEACQRILSRRG